MSRLILRCAAVSFAALAAALSFGPREALAQSRELVQLETRMNEARRAGKLDEALALATALVRTAERDHGEVHRITAAALGSLALVYDNLGRGPEAESAYNRVIDIQRRTVGAEDPEVAITLHNLATLQMTRGRYDEAETSFKRSLAIRQKRLPPGHLDIAVSHNNMGNLYRRQSRFAEAETSYRSALAILEKAPGQSARLNQVTASLGNLRRDQARYGEAVEIFERVLAAQRKEFGVEGLPLAPTLVGLGEVHAANGRHGEAEALYRRSLAIRERQLGETHFLVGETLAMLAGALGSQGRYREAEAVHRRALAIREQAVGVDGLNVAYSLQGLAWLYQRMGRLDDAAILIERAIAILERKVGAGSGDVANAVSALARVRLEQGKVDQAVAAFERAAGIWSRVHGPDHPNVAYARGDIARARLAQRRHTDADAAFRQAIGMLEKQLGPDHVDLAEPLHGLAISALRQGRPADAEALARRAVAVAQTSLGPGHRETGRMLHVLGRALVRQERHEQAVQALRQAAAIHAAEPVSDHEPGRGAGADEDAGRTPAMDLAAALWRLSRSMPDRGEAPAAEAFEAAQRVGRQLTGAALAQMAVRATARDPRLAKAVRDQQDLALQRQQLDRSLIEALSQPRERRNDDKIARLRQSMSEAEARIRDLGAEIARQLPAHAELTAPKPLPLAEAQRLLGPDEVMVVYLPTRDDGTLVWAVTREGFRWARSPLGETALAEKITALRRGLDVPDLAKAAAEGGLFDLGLAHELHDSLIGPVAETTRAKSQLVVVASGALTSLPFHVLVEEKPAVPKPREAEIGVYRTTPWLIRRQSVAVLPSVASLRALRSLAKASRAPRPLIGFADPIFSPGAARPAAPATRARATRSYASAWQGGAVDLDTLRRGLDPLPETETELKAVASALGAPAGDVHLAAAATEARVKQLDLSPYRIVYFATHGLVAGEVGGLGEPALVMTLPAAPTAEDDGLLTASEVAQLALDADWVVLSACNTAAGDAPGADALSGLARAFFYAGTRALLVSHWRVESEAAVRLTTATFDLLQREPATGRAEALRRAMLAMIDAGSRALDAYPDTWAPFSVVGEGNR